MTRPYNCANNRNWKDGYIWSMRHFYTRFFIVSVYNEHSYSHNFNIFFSKSWSLGIEESERI